METHGKGVLSWGILMLLFSTVTIESKNTEENLLQADSELRIEDTERYGNIEEKYVFLWNPLRAAERGILDLESEPCEKNETCYEDFINMNAAFHFDSDLPSKPYCQFTDSSMESKEDSKNGFCTCGPGRCVSYSRDSENNSNVFYYCGPCGWVGSECSANHTCTHSMARCSNDFCECVHDGIFYNMAFCYMPFYGKRMITQMFISTAIIIALCGVLAYSYHRLSGSRRHDLRRFTNWRRNSTTGLSPPDDTPPTYDDVVEKVPSYQDAIEMERNNINLKGLSNPAFEDDYTLPPSYEASFEIKIEEVSTVESRDSSAVDPETTKDQHVTQTTPDLVEEEISKTQDVEPQPIEQPLKEALVNMKTDSIVTNATSSQSSASDEQDEHNYL